MAKKKEPASAAPAKCFFAEELKGEEPLARATGLKLCRLAGELAAHQPWARLAETELVFVRDAVRAENDACSVMGMLGEVFAVTVYLGAEGFHFFQKLQRSVSISAGDFFAGQRSLSVEYVPRKELTRQDRELLDAAAYPTERGSFYPRFRSVRPGYQPWYATQGEGRILVGCLDAVAAFCQVLTRPDCPDFWERENVYPLVEHDESGYDLRPVEAPKATPATPAPVALDEARIRRILERQPGAWGPIEADHFHTAARVGGPHERPACAKFAIAADSGNGFAFPPVTGMPEKTTGELLADAILTAVETTGAIPKEIRVRSAEHKALAEGLAKALGSKVTVVKSLPALDAVKRSLLEMLGDTGPIAVR